MNEKFIHMRKLFYGIMMLIIASCAQQTEQAAADEIKDESVDLSKLPSADLFSDGKSELIKKAELKYQVVDLKKSRSEIDNAIRKYSAFISSADLKYDNPILEEQLTIRVLNSAFEPLMQEIERQAHYINYRKINSEDVSKEFVDLESRLRSKREMQQRYAEIVRSKVTTTEALLKAEYEIGKLHEEIEAVVSRINFLKDQVRYSTISLSLYQVMEQQAASIGVSKPLGSEFINAFKNGWNGLTNLLVILTNVWPFLLLTLTGTIYWHRRRKSLLRAKTQ